MYTINENAQFGKLSKPYFINEDGRWEKLPRCYFVNELGKWEKLWGGGAGRWGTVSYALKVSHASTDLTTWNTSGSTFTKVQGITYGGGKFYVLDMTSTGTYPIWASEDCLTWTKQGTISGKGTMSGPSFCYFDGKLFLHPTTGQKYFYYSANGGVSWTAVATPTVADGGSSSQQYRICGIAYGLVDGYTEEKYFVYVYLTNTDMSGWYMADRIFVYSKSLVYESTIGMITQNDIIVHYSNSLFMGVSNGSLKIIHDRTASSQYDYGALIFTVLKNGTMENKHIYKPSSSNSMYIGGVVCTNDFTAWFNDLTEELYVYEDATDTVTERSKPSAMTYVPTDNGKGCTDGDKYAVINGTALYYSPDKGATWTKVTISGAGGSTRDINCDIDGGGTWQC